MPPVQGSLFDHSASAHPAQRMPEGLVTGCRYWIGVVSHSHVQRGVAGGFAQLCHGKAAPLRRMRPGDWLIYYSPKTDFDNGTPLQCFTAIGRVVGEAVYPFEMAPGFIPFRRDITYLPCHSAPILPLLRQLAFIPDPRRWGYPFRQGHFEINAADFALIRDAMGVPADA